MGYVVFGSILRSGCILWLHYINILDCRHSNCARIMLHQLNIPILYCVGQLTINNLRTVQSAVWEARVKWLYIGLELGLNRDTLDAIKKKNPNITDNCFTEMLTVWLKMVNPPPTWSALADALKLPTVGYGQLGEQVESKYVSDVSDSHQAIESQEGEIIG